MADPGRPGALPSQPGSQCATTASTCVAVVGTSPTTRPPMKRAEQVLRRVDRYQQQHP